MAAQNAASPRYLDDTTFDFDRRTPCDSPVNHFTPPCTPQVVPRHVTASYDSAGTPYLNKHFSVVKKLGSGSFGEVFQVQSRKESGSFAVKKARRRYKGIRDRERLLAEVDSMTRVSQTHSKWSNNVVKFYSCWEEQGFLHMQLELCDDNLQDFVQRNDSLSESDIWRITLEMVRGLLHVHTCGLVHMDVKPSNYFICRREPSEGKDPNLVVKLGDFGLSTNQSQRWDDGMEGDARYIAPELLREIGQVNKYIDSFSLGMSLFQLVERVELPNEGKYWRMFRESPVGIQRCLPEEAWMLRNEGSINKEACATGESSADASHFSDASTIRADGQRVDLPSLHLKHCGHPVVLQYWKEMELLIGLCLSNDPRKRPALECVERSIEYIIEKLEESARMHSSSGLVYDESGTDESTFHSPSPRKAYGRGPSSPFSVAALSPMAVLPSPLDQRRDKLEPSKLELSSFDESVIQSPATSPTRIDRVFRMILCPASGDESEVMDLDSTLTADMEHTTPPRLQEPQIPSRQSVPTAWNDDSFLSSATMTDTTTKTKSVLFPTTPWSPANMPPHMEYSDERFDGSVRSRLFCGDTDQAHTQKSLSRIFEDAAFEDESDSSFTP